MFVNVLFMRGNFPFYLFKNSVVPVNIMLIAGCFIKVYCITICKSWAKFTLLSCVIKCMKNIKFVHLILRAF